LSWHIEWDTDKQGKPLLPDLLRWKKQGLKTPLDDKPELRQEDAKYYEAYKCLNYSRNMNGTIPFSEIRSYIEFYGITERERFIQIIQALDSAYLQKTAEKGS